MRFMVIVKASRDTEAGVMPSEQMFVEMGKYNEELVKAGVMKGGDGLQPSSKGARVKFSGKKRTVVDGPFAETKELIAGFWLWETKSLAEAIEWAKRCPNPTGDESELEIRQIFEIEDFEIDLRLALDRGVLVPLERAPAQRVDRAMLRGRHEPRTRLVGHALGRPLLERCHERILCELFGDADVAYEPSEPGDQARRLDAKDRFDGASRFGVVGRAHGRR